MLQTEKKITNNIQKEDNINNVNHNKYKNYDNENEITFTNHSFNYGIGIISIVNLSQEIDELDLF
jgi:hypothetical protein